MGLLPHTWSQQTRRWVRNTLIVLGVLFVIGPLPWLWANWKLGRELKAELERIKAAGEPLTILDAIPRDVPDDQNAAVLYQKVLRVSFDPRYAGSGGGGFSDIPNASAVDTDYVSEGTNKALARQVLNDPRAVQRLEILRQASKRPHSVFEVNWEDGAGALFPHMAKLREATRWVTAKMLMTAADGDVDGALEWCEVALGMSEHAAQEPTLIGQLVAVAMQAIVLNGTEQVLNEGAPSAAAAQRLIEYLPNIDMRGHFADAMLGERAWGRWCFQEARRNRSGFAGGFGVGGPELDYWPLYLYSTPLGEPVLKSDELVYLDLMRKHIEAVRLPSREAASRLHELQDEGYRIPVTAPISKILLPVFSRAHMKRDQAIAQLGELRIVLALKVFKQQHGGYPASLADLQKGLSWKVPEDVFSGKPLRYQTKGDGFILYSLGSDLDDDGGLGPKAAGKSWEDCDIAWQCTK
jgi:hypothetical protein